MKNRRYFAFLTHSITTLTRVEGLRCPLSLCIVSKKANASFNPENLEHGICFHDNHQRSTTRSTKYNCHSIFLPFISNPLVNTHNLWDFEIKKQLSYTGCVPCKFEKKFTWKRLCCCVNMNSLKVNFITRAYWTLKL